MEDGPRKRRRLVWSSSPESARTIEADPAPDADSVCGSSVAGSICDSAGALGFPSDGPDSDSDSELELLGVELPETCDCCGLSVCGHCLRAEGRCACSTSGSPSAADRHEVLETGCCLSCNIDVCSEHGSEFDSTSGSSA